MPVPQSNQFGVCDWNARAASTQSAGDRLITDGLDGFLQYTDYQDPEVLALGGAITLLADATELNGAITKVVRATAPLPVPDVFTFEFDISLTTDLPENFSNPENRLFVAAADSNGYVAGFLFSKQGMALATHAEDPTPTLLSGAPEVMYGDDGELSGTLTIRANMDALSGRLAVYLTRTPIAYNQTSGGTNWAEYPDLALRNNVQGRRSDGKYGSGIVLYASAQSSDRARIKNLQGVGQSVAFGVHSLRIHGGLNIPKDRPIAVVSAPNQLVVGAPATLNGLNSYSKDLAPVSCLWEIESAPDGSTAILEGAVRSSLMIGNELIVRHRRPTSTSNSYQVVLQAAPAQSDQIGFTFLAGVLTIRLRVAPGVGGNLFVSTTASQLIDAFSRKSHPAFNQLVFDRFEIVLGPTAGNSPLPTGTYTFYDAGATLGKGSDLAVTRLVPDVLGAYTVSLVVNNGTRPSFKVTSTIRASLTEQLLGHRPNTRYLFKHISDFWNLVPDKGQIETVWSAITQVISAETLTAWQNDYNKSLKSISRTYQRRWRNYSTYVEEGAHYNLIGAHFSQPLVAAFQINSTADITVCRVINVVTPDNIAPAAPGNKLLLRSNLMPPKVMTVESVVRVNNNPIEWSITFRETAPFHEVLGGSRTGRFISNPLSPQSPTSAYFTTDGYSLNGAQVGDLIRIKVGKVVDILTVSQVNPVVNNQPTENLLVLSAARPVGGLPLVWDHLRAATGTFVESVPYLRYVNGTDLGAYGLVVGDYADLEMTVPTSGITVPISLPLDSVDAVTAFVDWRPLYGLLNQFSPGGPNPGSNPREWDDRDLALLGLRLLRFRYHRVIPGHEDLVSIPVLGSTVAGLLSENTDYRISESGDVQVKDWLRGYVLTTPQSNVITFAPETSIFHIDFGHHLTWEELVDLGATTLVLEGGDAGTYTIIGKGAVDNQYLVDRPVRTSFLGIAHVPRHHHQNKSPDDFWAEVSFFSNHRAIENNFGLYVGLPRDLLDQHTDNVDYLTVVRSMWFAFMNGPTLGNLRLPLQAMLGAPITDSAGQVIRLVTPTPESPGVVVMIDRDGFQHTYPVGPGLPLALNPTTGRPIQEYQLIQLAGYPRDLVETAAWLLGGSEPRPESQLLLLAQHVQSASDAPDEMVALAAWLVENYKTVPRRRDLYIDWLRAVPVPIPVDAYLDATLPANFGLTDVVLVDDYVSNPALIDRTLVGQDSIQKFHTFVVEVPLRLSRSTSMFTLMERFLDQARAAHTDYLMIGKLDFQDDVVVTDSIRYDPTLRLLDSPSSSPFSAKPTSNAPGLGASPYTGQNAAPFVPLSVENQLWPVIGATQAFAAFQNPQPLSSGTRIGDVKERYEAGYVEGVLDNYSGDGSLNSQVSPVWVDPVNQHDHGDIDVCRSKMWIPVQKQADGKNFLIGEKLELLDQSLAPINTVWSVSPPVVQYVGAGVDPQLPGVTFQQEDHQFTYLWVGFEYVPDQTYDCLGIEERLDALVTAAAAAQGVSNVVVRGVTSAASATLLAAPDRTDPLYVNHFHLDKIFRNDKSGDFGPEDQIHLTMLQYIPFGGKTISAFQGESASFTDINYYRAVQTQPYRPNVPLTEQFVPSVGPGAYTQWGAVNPATTNVNWGYGGPGNNQDISAVPTAITAFTRTANPDLENLHYGMTLASKKGLQFSQGFTLFEFPSPVIKRVSKDNNTTLRIEGHFFVEPEAGVTPTPTTFPGGQLGGSWVFVRQTGDVNTGNWTSATAVVFESGTGNGTNVLGVPNAQQTSTGHVLIATIPANLPVDGTYDVVVQHYRPYPTVQQPNNLRIDTAVAVGGFSSQAGVLTATYFETPFFP